MVIDAHGEPELLSPEPPSAEMVYEQNLRQRAIFLEYAGNALAPLQTAIMLGDATDAEVAYAREWVAYTRAVKIVDLSIPHPAWPTMPEIAGSN